MLARTEAARYTNLEDKDRTVYLAHTAASRRSDLVVVSPGPR